MKTIIRQAYRLKDISTKKHIKKRWVLKPISIKPTLIININKISELTYNY